MTRKNLCLERATELVTGPRADDYGSALRNFKKIAELWEPIIGVRLSPEEVALCMVQIKVSRLLETPGHEDSWVDIAGYAACGMDCHEPEFETN